MQTCVLDVCRSIIYFSQKWKRSTWKLWTFHNYSHSVSCFQMKWNNQCCPPFFKRKATSIEKNDCILHFIYSGSTFIIALNPLQLEAKCPTWVSDGMCNDVKDPWPRDQAGSPWCRYEKAMGGTELAELIIGPGTAEGIPPSWMMQAWFLFQCLLSALRLSRIKTMLMLVMACSWNPACDDRPPPNSCSCRLSPILTIIVEVVVTSRSSLIHCLSWCATSSCSKLVYHSLRTRLVSTLTDLIYLNHSVNSATYLLCPNAILCLVSSCLGS